MWSPIEKNNVFGITFLTEVDKFCYIKVGSKGIDRQLGVLPNLVSGHVLGQVETEHVLIEKVEGANKHR